MQIVYNNQELLICHAADTAATDWGGKITAVDSGSCKVYVQTVNGIWKTVKVNVN